MLAKSLHSVSAAVIHNLESTVFEWKNSLRNSIFPGETFLKVFITQWITIFQSNMIFDNGGRKFQVGPDTGRYLVWKIEGNTARFLMNIFWSSELVAVFFGQLVFVKCSPFQCSFISNQGCKISSPCPFKLFFNQLVCVKCSPLQYSFISNQGCKISSTCPFKLKLFFNQLVCVKCVPLQYSPPFTF